MHWEQWVLSVLGALVVLITLVDVALTVLHTDLNGPIGDNVHRGIWQVVVRLTRRLPRLRRSTLALSGPVMMLSMFAVWAGLYILGFALLVWPHLNMYRTASGQEAATFADAFYYSGITATVLGYGDITPRTGLLQVVAVVESGMGFAMFSGVVTWLINVVSGVSERDALALRVEQETDGTHDGVRLVERCGADRHAPQLERRFSELAHAVQQLHPKLRQFPVLDLHYRGQNASLAPERMVRSLAQAAIAGHVLAEESSHQLLRPAAAELDRAVTDVMQLIARQHLPARVREALMNPMPEMADRSAVAAIRRRLLPTHAELDAPPPIEGVRLAYRLRLWLDAMDRLSGWRIDEDQ